MSAPDQDKVFCWTCHGHKVAGAPSDKCTKPAECRRPSK